METNNSASKIMMLLLKDFSSTHTITSIAKEMELSRVGVWKVLKKLEADGFIRLISVGKGKTSTSVVRINWDNILVEKALPLYLTEEALKQRRWVVNFGELESVLDFLILYGSILNFPKSANDIDIVSVVSNKRQFTKIQNIINKIQKTQSKKIHAINFTESEFMNELKGKNEAFINAIRKGVILFGQENFVKFMQRVQ